MKNFAEDPVFKVMDFIQHILLYISIPLLVLLFLLALFTYFVKKDVKSTILLIIAWLIIVAILIWF